MSQKIDRIEFSQIVQNKANTFEVQKLVTQLMKSKTFDDFKKNESLLCDSINVSISDGLTYTDRTHTRSISQGGQTPDRIDIDRDQIQLGPATERGLVVLNQQFLHSTIGGITDTENIVYKDQEQQFPTNGAHTANEDGALTAQSKVQAN